MAGAKAALTLAAAAALVLLLAPPASPEAPRVVRVLEPHDLDAATPLREWSGKPLSLADVDGDGRLDLLAQNQNGRVYVVDLERGKALLELEPDYPYGPDLGPFNGPRAADLDGDGLVEIVNVNRAAVVSVWSVRPAPGGEGVEAALRWELHLDAHHGHPTADAGPALGDLDGDGLLEIVAQTEETGVFALRHDGSVLWSRDDYGGNADPLVADADLDGDLDAVFFTDAGVARAIDGATGGALWRFDAQRHGVWPGSAATPGVVGDLDGDGTVETAFCARNLEDATPEYAPGAPRYLQHHFALVLARGEAREWVRKPSWGNPLCAARLMAHDADGDGRAELFGMDWNTVGHKPGNWERLGDAHAFAFDLDGDELWHASLDPWNAKASLAMADADGDGDQDVLAYDRDELVALDARTGKRAASVHLRGWTVKQGPVVADVDGDGALEAVVAVEGRSHAFLVVSLPASSAEPAWPGWEKVAPGAPRAPTAPPPAAPTPPLPGDSATFTPAATTPATSGDGARAETSALPLAGALALGMGALVGRGGRGDGRRDAKR